ncbi:hypothetical protein ACFL4P_01645 [Gemmatimonadota bacterium]
MDRILFIIAQALERSFDLLLGQPVKFSVGPLENFGGETLAGGKWWMDRIQISIHGSLFFFIDFESAEKILQEVNNSEVKKRLKGEKNHRGKMLVTLASLTETLEILCNELGFRGEFLHCPHKVTGRQSLEVLSRYADEIPKQGFWLRFQEESQQELFIILLPEKIEERLKSTAEKENGFRLLTDKVLEFEYGTSLPKENMESTFSIDDSRKLAFTRVFFPAEHITSIFEKVGSCTILPRKLTVMNEWDPEEIDKLSPLALSRTQYLLPEDRPCKAIWLFPFDLLKSLAAKVGVKPDSLVNELLSGGGEGLTALLRCPCICEIFGTKLNTKIKTPNKLKKYIVEVDYSLELADSESDSRVSLIFKQYVSEVFITQLISRVVTPEERIYLKRSIKNLFLSLLDLSWAMEYKVVSGDSELENISPYLSCNGENIFLSSGIDWQDLLHLDPQEYSTGMVIEDAIEGAEIRIEDYPEDIDSVREEELSAALGESNQSGGAVVEENDIGKNQQNEINGENEKPDIKKKNRETGEPSPETANVRDEELATIKDMGETYYLEDAQARLKFSDLASLPGHVIQLFLGRIAHFHDDPEDLYAALYRTPQSIFDSFLNNMSSLQQDEFLYHLSYREYSKSQAFKAQERLVRFFLEQVSDDKLELPKNMKSLTLKIKAELLEARRQKWRECLENSSVAPNLRKLKKIHIRRLYDVFSRKDICMVLFSLERELRERIMTVLPKKIRSVYDDEISYLARQEQEGLLSYEKIIACFMAIDDYMRSAYCSLSETSDKVRPGTHGGKDSEPESEDINSADSVLDTVNERIANYERDSVLDIELDTITSERAMEIIYRCHSDLHRNESNREKATEICTMGCQLALKFQLGDIGSLNCLTYYLADYGGPGELSLKAARMMYDRAMEIAAGNLNRYLPVEKPYQTNQMRLSNIAFTWAWVLHINRDSRQALQILDECKRVPKSKDQEKIFNEHYKKVKKAVDK